MAEHPHNNLTLWNAEYSYLLRIKFDLECAFKYYDPEANSCTNWNSKLRSIWAGHSPMAAYKFLCGPREYTSDLNNLEESFLYLFLYEEICYLIREYDSKFFLAA